jgi:hypothetical protein
MTDPAATSAENCWRLGSANREVGEGRARVGFGLADDVGHGQHLRTERDEHRDLGSASRLLAGCGVGSRDLARRHHRVVPLAVDDHEALGLQHLPGVVGEQGRGLGHGGERAGAGPEVPARPRRETGEQQHEREDPVAAPLAAVGGRAQRRGVLAAVVGGCHGGRRRRARAPA